MINNSRSLPDGVENKKKNSRVQNKTKRKRKRIRKNTGLCTMSIHYHSLRRERRERMSMTILNTYYIQASVIKDFTSIIDINCIFQRYYFRLWVGRPRHGNYNAQDQQTFLKILNITLVPMVVVHME